jgi:hypothetical protein
VDDAAAEPRAPGEGVVDVKRIRVTRDLDETPDVFIREGLSEARPLAGLEIFDPRDPGGSQCLTRAPPVPAVRLLARPSARRSEIFGVRRSARRAEITLGTTVRKAS